MQRHFTATVYLFHEDTVLLHPHPKLGKWLPPGGHIEPNETPPEAASREALEETGIEIALLEQENLKVQAYNAISIPRPFLCLLEEIPARKDQSAHQHIDFIYLARPLNIPTSIPNGFQWLTLEQAMAKDLFPDTEQVIRLLLTSDVDADLLSLDNPCSRGTFLPDRHKKRSQRQRPDQSSLI